VKTTVDIADALLLRAKRHARKTGRPLRALFEEGLRAVLDTKRPGAQFRLRDESVGRAGEPNPLESMTWADLRGEIYGGR
jgi:hypothetical protein